MQRVVRAWMCGGLVMALLACGGETSTTEATKEAPAPEAQPEAAAVADAPKPEPMSEKYQLQAQALVRAIDGGTTAPEILTMAETLTQTGLSMLPAMVKEHPACEAYLGAIAAVGPLLKDMPLEEIETGYHADGKLPEMPSPECYHGKDLVVHPGTVAALAKAGLSTDEDRMHAKAEIVEVLSHLGALDASEQ